MDQHQATTTLGRLDSALLSSSLPEPGSWVGSGLGKEQLR